LFANSELEADITTALLANSARSYLLCDDSKIGKESYLRFADLDKINILITNSRSEELAYFRKAGIEIIEV
jgi:DeoR family fructose operon transcriptional repressor